MKKLTVLDLAFFLFETEASPKHVAGLMVFSKPAKCPADYARRLVDELKTHDDPAEPFNLVPHLVGLQGPQWKPCEQFSIDDHVFYHRPAEAMNWPDVRKFVSGLHEPAMDRSKPLWEYHLIDRIEGNRFAVYAKIHHAYADGLTMTSWMNKTLSESPDEQQLNPVWAMRKPARKPHGDKSSFLGKTIRSLTGQTWDQVLATAGIAKLSAQQLLERTGLTHDAVSLHFNQGSDTPLTGYPTPGRHLATAWVPMKSVKRLGKETLSTLNHVALSCIDGALHRYLAESGITLDHPITIQMPVSLRKDEDDTVGNKVCVVLVDLAQPTDDPRLRLRDIGYALSKVRSQVDGVPGTAMEQYSVLSAVYSEMLDKLKLSRTLPVNGHTLVSNVPGPKNPLYLKGAKLEHMYPISILLPGMNMNITMFSYAGKLHFGIVATHDLEELDQLAAFIEQELENLEQAVFGA